MGPGEAFVGFGFIWIAFVLFMAAVGIAGTIFWIVEIIDVAQRKFSDPNLKIVWMLVIIFGHFIGALIYFFVGKQQGTISTEPYPQSDAATYDNIPVVSYTAKVTAKRTAISPLQSISTLHFATFEAENGNRTELSLSGPQYGIIAEGDTGILHSQGTRFLSFVREVPNHA
jgi:hypothetical protein